MKNASKTGVTTGIHHFSLFFTHQIENYPEKLDPTNSRFTDDWTSHVHSQLLRRIKAVIMLHSKRQLFAGLSQMGSKDKGFFSCPLTKKKKKEKNRSKKAFLSSVVMTVGVSCLMFPFSKERGGCGAAEQWRAADSCRTSRPLNMSPLSGASAHLSYWLFWNGNTQPRILASVYQNKSWKILLKNLGPKYLLTIIMPARILGSSARHPGMGVTCGSLSLSLYKEQRDTKNVGGTGWGGVGKSP